MVTDRQSPSPYTVLARRFRPKSFAEVVGQEHVGQALQNAIRAGRVAHAYLFTGARGVGKTSSARIFAKALNCPHVKDGVPCNHCEVCDSIGAGSDVDVLEIDGASNRGIDDIRQLRANVGVRSMRSPYKVYIIDEVHMLTKEAFNALLKTLEEPPPNVKFIFCTTEPNKVPDTILSRCQRFDFGTIDQESIAGRLRQIAEAEGKTVEEDAIELVARRANGSMRDSQSLFDQLLAFGGERITADDVHHLLGTASDDRLFTLIDACIESQPGTALEVLEAAMQQGVQTGGLTDQLLGYLRDLLVTAAGAKGVPLSAVTDNQRAQVQKQAERWGLQTISAAMQIVAETKNRLQRTTHGRALLELAVVRLATLERLDQISVLLQSGVIPSTASGSVATPAGRPAPTGPFYQGMQEKKNSNPAVIPSSAPVANQPATQSTPSVANTAPITTSAPLPTSAPASAAVPASEPIAATTAAPVTAIHVASERVTAAPTVTEPQSAAPGPPAPSPIPPQAPKPAAIADAAPIETATIATPEYLSDMEDASEIPHVPFDEAHLAEYWHAVVSQMSRVQVSKLKVSNRIAISGPNLVEIFFPKSYSFAKQYCEQPETLKRLNFVTTQVAGKQVDCKLTIDPTAEVQIKAPERQENAIVVERLKPSAVEADQFVQLAVAVFGGQVLEVRPLLDAPPVNDTESELPAEDTQDDS
ncbi:DNA polymerase III subunit gamma/tau [Planctomicrobium sp. SH527]|uniref:DNA polymerase III subunit gamma/tau n=1 Tax=Planctomicrobium sp. SH527 TaxID=3448123 RepID=UPI003F5C488B